MESEQHISKRIYFKCWMLTTTQFVANNLLHIKIQATLIDIKKMKLDILPFV